MNIQIMGRAKYTGSRSSLSLIEAEHKVVLFNNFSNSDPSVLNYEEKVVGKKLLIKLLQDAGKIYLFILLRIYLTGSLGYLSSLCVKAFGNLKTFYCEVQSGSYLGEDGFERLDYFYGRLKN